jgi:hypothetical protein
MAGRRLRLIHQITKRTGRARPERFHRNCSHSFSNTPPKSSGKGAVSQLSCCYFAVTRCRQGAGMEGDFPTAFVVVVLVGALLVLKFYFPARDRIRRPKTFQPSPTEPRGPQAPTGLPEARISPVDLGRFGPQYLTGEMREESEKGLELVRAMSPGQPVANPPIPEMAGDVLGALRWLARDTLSLDDVWLNDYLGSGYQYAIEQLLMTYRDKVPPGPERDQGMNILGFYLQNLHDTTVRVAVGLAIAALRKKLEREGRL